MNLGKIFKNLALPTALVASVGACSTSNYDQREGAALGGALGGVLAGAAADALGVDSRTRRSIERAGTLAGAAQGSAITAGNVFCTENSSTTRNASRDNLIGRVMADTTSQRQSEVCTGGRRPVGQSAGPKRIF